jgi:hypothetical protein
MGAAIIANAHDLNNAQEIWFIQNELFRGAPITVGFEPGVLVGKKVIYLELNEISGELIQLLKADKNKVILYHMGDEFARMSRVQYDACDLVVRNYFFPSIHDDSSSTAYKVIWAPCGPKTGVGPRNPDDLKGALERRWISVFLGWLKNPSSVNNERVAFSQIAPQCGSNLFVQPSESFGGGWNVGLYSAVMESAIFAPCPAGNSAETIRLFDALQLGSIPISLSHEFLLSTDALALIGPVPFPILESWSELPAFLDQMKAKLISSPNEILELQQRCIHWWSDYKLAIQKKIADRISAL